VGHYCFVVEGCVGMIVSSWESHFSRKPDEVCPKTRSHRAVGAGSSGMVNM
jgi:hypothetical protein